MSAVLVRAMLVGTEEAEAAVAREGGACGTREGRCGTRVSLHWELGLHSHTRRVYKRTAFKF